jgi:ribosome-binding factor A
VNELLKREIGSALYRIINSTDFDMSAVTVTHVITSPDLRKARVFISVRSDESEKQGVLDGVKRHRQEIQKAISDVIVLKYTPRLSFSLDESLSKGDNILTLLNEIEETEPDGE